MAEAGQAGSLGYRFYLASRSRDASCQEPTTNKLYFMAGVMRAQQRGRASLDERVL